MRAKVRQVNMTARDGNAYDTLCLPLDLLPGWLFGVTTGKIKPDL
jgi:hypothetical protein